MMMPKITVSEIDALLPQTQCKECGYDGCLPYAAAIQKGASIGHCPPGGTKTVHNLAKLLQIDPTPYLSEASRKERTPALALIKESECIGCTKCIQACPIDAIIGAAKQMHSVLPNECTGCGLCVPACPVDCIEMIPVSSLSYQPSISKKRFEAKKARSLSSKKETTDSAQQTKKAYILEALERTKHKRLLREQTKNPKNF